MKKIVIAGLILPLLAVTFTTHRSQALTEAQSLYPLYRLYNPQSGDHMETSQAGEIDSLIRSRGYNFEGVLGYVHSTTSTGRVGLWRLYNPTTHDYLLTTDINERNAIKSHHGYTQEEFLGHILSQQTAREHTYPLYRLYNPKNGDHMYTTLYWEKQSALGTGYIDEGMIGRLESENYHHTDKIARPTNN